MYEPLTGGIPRKACHIEAWGPVLHHHGFAPHIVFHGAILENSPSRKSDIVATFLELGGTSHRILMGEASSILASSLSLVLTSKELGLCCLQGQGCTELFTGFLECFRML